MREKRITSLRLQPFFFIFLKICIKKKTIFIISFTLIRGHKHIYNVQKEKKKNRNEKKRNEEKLEKTMLKKCQF